MRITVLIENHPCKGLLHEHGLSLHLEYRGRQYLLDGGASGRMAQNAASLGIRLDRVDAAVLSHGHYDHADGLDAFLRLNTGARVYARPAVTEPDYFKLGPIQKSIGVNPALFAAHLPRFDLEDGPRALAPGLHLIPDQVRHEQSLVAETGRGLVVMNACCHAGAGEIVRDILARFPGQRVCALLGGFHLMGPAGPKTLGMAPEEVKALAHRLTDELGVEDIYTGHCTGQPAYAILKAELGGRLHDLSTGTVVAFEDRPKA